MDVFSAGEDCRDASLGGRVGTERRRRRRRKRRRRRRNRDTAPQRQCVPEAWKRDHAPGWLRKGVYKPGISDIIT